MNRTDCAIVDLSNINGALNVRTPTGPGSSGAARHTYVHFCLRFTLRFDEGISAGRWKM